MMQRGVQRGTCLIGVYLAHNHTENMGSLAAAFKTCSNCCVNILTKKDLQKGDSVCCGCRSDKKKLVQREAVCNVPHFQLNLPSKQSTAAKRIIKHIQEIEKKELLHRNYIAVMQQQWVASQANIIQAHKDAEEMIKQMKNDRYKFDSLHPLKPPTFDYTPQLEIPQ
jgi:hypothetical protein